MPSRIEDYALIGDGHSAALVARDGSIDWLCWPRFDSPACFAALLGTADNGRWRIAANEGTPCRVHRRYMGPTLILETVIETAEGSASVIDFMTMGAAHPHLVRLVVGRSGTVALEMELILRFDYGESVPWVRRLDDGALCAIAGPDMVVLRTPVELVGEGLTTRSRFNVTEGQRIEFVLTYGASHQPVPATVDAEEFFHEVDGFWREWSARCATDGPWEDLVLRSLITLKALIYRPTGGIVAAPTTSLPESLGGVRNWDYRFCWLRDASLTLAALMNARYYEEAEAWQLWLHRAVAGSPAQMQIMYGLAGERRLDEWVAGHLCGYEGSQPVRIGNAASRQLQLDVYGEVMAAFHRGRHGGLKDGEANWAVQRAMIEHLAERWQEPDEGIWEVRGPSRHFTHSKVMAWVAVDRAIRAVTEFGLDGPLDTWLDLRRRIHEDVCSRGFDPDLNSFVQSYGSRELDASLLQIAMTGFLPADDPRVRGTVAAIERDLVVDGLVIRYRTEAGNDGLPAGEGRFLACSFWLVDNLVLQGRLQEARQKFESLLALCNDVGLLAEEYDTAAKRQVGNFPQAFSHVALVNTAFRLSNALASRG